MNEARRRLVEAASTAGAMHAVPQWWIATLAGHLVDELWGFSLHAQLPELAAGTTDGQAAWAELRRSYIQQLRARERSTIELWPSQVEAAARAVIPDDDLVVALPTSAGKTRIAELCILRTLADRRRAIYVTPLRALSAQIERELRSTFGPLGASVSSLYGSAPVLDEDAEPLRAASIVVATPEKLDFALRNAPEIIDDVGVLVFDEGHMLGPNEREVRYEALVQRLLRREDSATRRVVCLSALFPSPEEMADLVAWIRQDAPGAAVHSNWRPTRQRFGTLTWAGAAASLSIPLEGESPFVPRFVEAMQPPEGSRRRRAFPADKNELTLAAAWRFVQQGKRVLIYCSLRRSVETLGEAALKCIAQRTLTPLEGPDEVLAEALAVGTEWLGADHPAVRSLPHGIALHHGGLPRPFLTQVEELLRKEKCPVVIASPTLAQGLNLTASVLLVPSIWRNRETLPPAEFANVCGRAGRAFVDLEGLVVHVIWAETQREREYALRNWRGLVAAARAPRVVSGLLTLAWRGLERIAHATGIPISEVTEYVLGHPAAWDLAGETPEEGSQAQQDIASLDAAILGLLEANTPGEAAAAVLEGSLLERQLIALTDAREGAALRSFIQARVRRIWAVTNEASRRGYHAGGVGLRAGQFIDENIEELVEIAASLEVATQADAGDLAGDMLVRFAELVFRVSPFSPPRGLPDAWREAVILWMSGRPTQEVVRRCGADGIDFVQDVLTYRLPWALEAVRVHAAAIEHPRAGELRGAASAAVEVGSAHPSVVRLSRSGLDSREGAQAAVASTGIWFIDRPAMVEWLRSHEIRDLTASAGWPTPGSHLAWLSFYEREKSPRMAPWARVTQEVSVDWYAATPDAGFAAAVHHSLDGEQTLALSPDLEPMGVIRSRLEGPVTDVVDAVVTANGTLAIEYFGPRRRADG